MMLWMEEKGRVLVDEPSREPSNIMRKLRRHEAATCELAATQGHVEGLQQVRDAGTRVRGLLGFMFPLQEEWISLSRALASPSFLLHSAGNPGLSSLPGSSVHGILQARILEWGAIAFSRP